MDDLMNKYSYETHEQVRCIRGFHEGARGAIVKRAEGGSHWYLVQLDDHPHTTWIHYFDLKRVTSEKKGETK